MDTTFRGWSATLASRVRLAIARLVLIFALPFDFHCGVRVARSMHLPHSVEASLLASDSLRRLRSSVYRVSRRQPLACVGAVLGLLDGPTGCDPDFEWSGSGFVCCVRTWLCGLLRLVVLIVFLRWLARVALVMVQSIFSLEVLLRLASVRWDPLALASSRPGLHQLSNLAGPCSAFQGSYS